MSLKLLMAAVFIVVVLSACSGDGLGLNESGDLEGSEVEGVFFSSEVQPIFETHCTRCHVPGGVGFLGTGGESSGGLDLTAGAAFQGLVDVSTFEEPLTPPRWRVLPGMPDSSYLIEKIATSTPKFGVRMPLDGPPFLTDSEIRLIERWIEEGAPDN